MTDWSRLIVDWVWNLKEKVADFFLISDQLIG
jgi:hypothetical protein